MRVVEVAALEPAFDVDPHHARMIRAQARAFKSVGLVDSAVTVKQDGKCTADFVHPLLEGGQCSKRNDEDAGIEFYKFFLARAQLCGMFAAGYSAQVTEENEQGVSTFEDFAKGDLFTFDGLQGEVGGGGVEFEFQVSGSRCQVSGVRCQVTSYRLQVLCVRVYLFTCLQQILFCPNESLNDGDEDQQGKDRKQNGDICGEQ